MNKLVSFFRSFAAEDEGAQIIEYALIVAVVSIGLILLIESGLTANGAGITQWITRVSDCLIDGSCT